MILEFYPKQPALTTKIFHPFSSWRHWCIAINKLFLHYVHCRIILAQKFNLPVSKYRLSVVRLLQGWIFVATADFSAHLVRNTGWLGLRPRLVQPRAWCNTVCCAHIDLSGNLYHVVKPFPVRVVLLNRRQRPPLFSSSFTVSYVSIH